MRHETINAIRTFASSVVVLVFIGTASLISFVVGFLVGLAR